MPALPSFITGRKSKTSSSKSPFSILRGEPSAPLLPPQPPPPPPPPPPPLPYLRTDVIEINNRSRQYSLDFDGGRPNDEFEKAIFDQTSSIHSKPDNTESPQVKLDIEFSPGTFTDWFTSNLLANFPPSATSGLKAGGSGLQNEAPAVSMNGGGSKASNGIAELLPQQEDGKDVDSISTSSSEDVIANLRAMNPSHFGKLPGFEDFNRLDQPSTPKKTPPKPPLIITGGSKPQNGSPDSIPSSYKPSRPMSTPESLVSSAISGSTFARALMSNPYVLPSDSRASRYLRGAGGLARTDSTTLPRSEHSHGTYNDNDQFSIAPDAPPIPPNAEALYQPPKTPRGQVEGNDERDQTLKRRSSMSNVDVKALPQTPSVSSTRRTSTLLSPGVEFDMNSIIQPTTPEANSHKPHSIPRSPLPLPPTPQLPYLSSEDGHSSKHSSKQGSAPEEYQEAIQRFPLDSQLLSPDLSQLSPALSSGPPSGRDLDGVLNYYTLPDTPDIQPSSSYQPMFSPISEESISQLSPPLPPLSFKSPERRESTRSTPLGGRSPSGSPRGARTESVTLPRRPSDRSSSRAQSLLGVSERANTTVQASSPTSTYSTSSKASSVTPELLAPPPASTVFTRTRPGTAPSPIKVIRDSKDANAYKIMVSPQILENGTPTTEEGEDNSVMQEFPETPIMFSPTLTDDSHSASLVHVAANCDDVVPMSTVPLSATLPRRGSQSFAQAVLLTRAGTTIGHSKQPSITKAHIFNGTRSRSTSAATQHLDNPPAIAEPVALVQKEDSSSILSASNETTQLLTEEPDQIQRLEEQSAALNRISSISAQSRYSRASSLATSIGQGSDSSSAYSPSESSKRQRSLPAVPGSPLPHIPTAVASSASPSPAPSHASLPTQPTVPQPIDTSIPTPVPTIPPSSEPMSAVSDVNGIPFAPRIPPPPMIPPPSPSPSQKARLTLRGKMPPALTITNVGSASENTVAFNGPDTAEGSPASSIPTRQDMTNVPTTTMQNPNTMPLQDQSSLIHKGGPFGRDSDLFRGTSLGSPPPYYQAISDAIAHNAQNNSHNVNNDQTPTTSFPGSTFSFPPTNTSTSSISTPSAPSPPTSDWTSTPQPEFRAPSLVRENSMISQRSRMRPPLPAGPRRPSQIGVAGFPSHQFRDRSGSVSSVGSNLLMHAIREREASVTVSPKFQAPSPKWRGYTMEAAKWTFTSSQLQAIVSRAIRQSAEASSIRLLRLEILDNDIPEEIRRLQAQSTELQNRYKSWTRRRTALVDGLAMYMNGGDEDAPAYAVRMMEDLKDVTSMLDKFVEEMHSVDAQLAHLESLIQIHSGSALAMALRKLNTSFLKQVAENQTLRSQIQSLEAERDEAWQHAADAANELDKMESLSSSRRSSRISAVRKSSVRVSKAGLRTPSQRLSQLSSHGSGMQAFGLIPKSPMPRSVQRIPPVPSLPSARRRPSNLLTDLVNRSSAASPGYTPTSETEALIEAQDELYAMLGLKNPERPRRSRSISILSGGGSSAAGSAAHHAFLHGTRPLDTPALHRRSSLPGESTLAEAYNAMEVDRNAVLATIDMLSSAD